MIDKFILNYKSEKSIQVEIIDALQKEVIVQEESLNEHLKNHSNKNLFKRAFDFKTRKNINIEEKEIKNKKTNIDNILNDIETLKKSLFLNIKDELIKSNLERHCELHKELFSFTNIYEVLFSAYNSGKMALGQIQSAINSISSAETMETMDMVSNNKGISIMSTSGNQSAAASVRNANNYIGKFNEQLKISESTIKQIHHDSNIEIVDFVFDIFFDNGILDTVGSLMSLTALGNTKRELQKSYQVISKIVNNLDVQCKNSLLNKQNQELLIKDFEKPYEDEVNEIFILNSI